MLFNLISYEKLVLYVLGPLIGILYVFYRGWKYGKDQKELEQRRIEEDLQIKIKGAEAKNATEDWKRDQAINEVGNSNKSMLDLIQLWNSRWGGKDKDQSPPKEPK